MTFEKVVFSANFYCDGCDKLIEKGREFWLSLDGDHAACNAACQREIVDPQRKAVAV